MRTLDQEAAMAIETHSPDMLSAGGAGTDGQLKILGADGQPLAHVHAPTENPRRRDAELAVGGGSRNGVVRVKRAGEGRQTTISDSGMSLYGHLSMHSKDKNPVNINPFGDEVRVLLGDSGVSGHVQLSNGNNGPGPIIEIDGKGNAIRFGNPGRPDTSMIDIVGQQASVRVGGENVDGAVVVQGGDGKPRAILRGSDASLVIGGNGSNGTVSVTGADGQPLLELLARAGESVMGLGQANRPGRISLYNGARQEALRLDAATGDIVMANADCAEEFDVAEGEVEPGTVMVLTDDGPLVPSDSPYDTRVAGVVSGAGSYRPGLVLDRRDTGRQRAPIALMGKVYCKADARAGRIAIGDLLTTSEHSGHAMRIDDPARAFGAVLGKALAPLAGGRGLIPVLVAMR